MRPTDVARRFPLQTGVTLLAALALATTALFSAGMIPIVPSFSTFARLVFVTLFLVLVTVAAWGGPLLVALRRRVWR